MKTCSRMKAVFTILILLCLWLPCAPARADVIPALDDIPAGISGDQRSALVKQKQELEERLQKFQADGSAFNAKPAQEQSEEELSRLEKRREEYIADALAFNKRLDALVTLKIGVTARIAGQVSITDARGQEITIDKSGHVVIPAYALVKTGPDSQLQILLLDETTVTIGANGEIVLDDFVYDPNTTPKKSAARILKGLFRFVTGKVAHKDNMEVEAPVGAIGIRGTDLECIVNEDKSGVVKLREGEAEITPKSGGAKLELHAGQMYVYDAAGHITGPKPLE